MHNSFNRIEVSTWKEHYGTFWVIIDNFFEPSKMKQTSNLTMIRSIKQTLETRYRCLEIQQNLYGI